MFSPSYNKKKTGDHKISFTVALPYGSHEPMRQKLDTFYHRIIKTSWIKMAFSSVFLFCVTMNKIRNLLLKFSYSNILLIATKENCFLLLISNRLSSRDGINKALVISS